MEHEDAQSSITFVVNGDRRTAGVPSHWTLLEALRYDLGLTGSKQGCDKGDCGACTVLLDDVPTLSCITPVHEAEGRRVRTVEGLVRGPGEPHPLQSKFGEMGAAQCGFCTPGILCSAAALLERNPQPSRQDIKEALAGNLCRCTGYTKIFEAIEAAADEIRLSGAAPAPQQEGRDPDDRRTHAEEGDAVPGNPASEVLL